MQTSLRRLIQPNPPQSMAGSVRSELDGVTGGGRGRTFAFHATTNAPS